VRYLFTYQYTKKNVSWNLNDEIKYLPPSRQLQQIQNFRRYNYICTIILHIIFRTCPDRPWGPPSILYNVYRVFPVGKERPGRDADPSPSSRAVGHKRVELYLYSHYKPYGLYRTSLPVQGRPLPLPYYTLEKFCSRLAVLLFKIISSEMQCIARRYSNANSIYAILCSYS